VLIAMDSLERLYIRLERWEPLKDVYAKKADLAEDPEDKKQMLYVLGQVYDRELGDVAKAIDTYQAILDINIDELPAIQALYRLFGQAQRWYDLLQNLERQVELAESSFEAVGLKYRIGMTLRARPRPNVTSRTPSRPYRPTGPVTCEASATMDSDRSRRVVGMWLSEGRRDSVGSRLSSTARDCRMSGGGVRGLTALSPPNTGAIQSRSVGRCWRMCRRWA
jgi:tetratricopeptide (TPR) repeat protein